MSPSRGGWRHRDHLAAQAHRAAASSTLLAFVRRRYRVPWTARNDEATWRSTWGTISCNRSSRLPVKLRWRSLATPGDVAAPAGPGLRQGQHSTGIGHRRRRRSAQCRGRLLPLASAARAVEPPASQSGAILTTHKVGRAVLARARTVASATAVTRPMRLRPSTSSPAPARPSSERGDVRLCRRIRPSRMAPAHQRAALVLAAARAPRAATQLPRRPV